MKILSFITIFLIGLLFVSCNNNDKTSFNLINRNIVEYKIVKEIQLQDTSRIYNPIQFSLINDSTFIFNEYLGNYLVTYWNLKTGKIIDSIGKIGNGPDEVVSQIFFFTFLDTVEIYSPRNMRYLTFVGGKNIKTYNLPESNFSSTIRINDNLFTGVGYFDSSRIGLFNIEKNKLRTFCDYPYFDKFNNYSNFLINFISDGRIIMNLNRNKFAFCSFNTGTLEFFSIQADSVTKYKEYKFLNDDQIIIDNVSDGSFITADYSENSNYGFRDIARSQKYLYSLWDGQKRKNSKGSNLILCFDWLGNYVKTIKLEKYTSLFSVSNNDNFIVSYDSQKYAITIFKKK